MTCTLCPRACGVDRTSAKGFCGAGERPTIARAALHFWEEPSLSGTRGSGAIFFCGCNLDCLFCQNHEINHTMIGRMWNEEELAALMLHLQAEGAHNINLVTPTPHVDTVIPAVLGARKRGLMIPIVYNTNGYETLDTLRRLEGIVDIYLPDLKYASSLAAERYSGAKDYFDFASKAILEMHRQCGELSCDENGLAQRGVIVRLMPAYLNDALKERTYDEKFSPAEEPYTGIISVWHIVGFKPYSGSMSTALAAIAKGIERRHHGVFFDVIAMDEAEYTERLARGESPDLLSFPLGVCYPDQLSTFDELPVECISKDMAAVGEWDGKIYALPYAMSAHALIVNTGLFQERGAMLPEGTRNAAWILQAAETFAAAQKSGKQKQLPALSGNAVLAAALGLTGEVAEYDAFRSGKAAIAIADLRSAGDLEALQSAGKGFAFEASILSGDTSLVQMIGLSHGIDQKKRAYAIELIERIFSETAQKQFAQLGLISVTEVDPKALPESALLASAAEHLREPKIPNAFLLQRYRDALEETARRVLAGDAEAKKDFEARLKELVSGT